MGKNMKAKISLFILILLSTAFADSAEIMISSQWDLIYKEERIDQALNTEGEIIDFYNKYIDKNVEVKKHIKYVYGNLNDDINRKFWNKAMTLGDKWGPEDFSERNDNLYCYYVEAKETVTVPAGRFENCFKIIYETCPDKESFWYYPEVGIIKYEYDHHGTVTNIKRELVKIIKK